MTIRKKSLLAIALTLICLVVILSSISSLILVNGFSEVEQQDTQKNVNRALGALSEKILNMKSLNSDWAKWDDTYKFIEDDNYKEEYIQTNLYNNEFKTINVNFMIFINNSGGVVFAKVVNFQDMNEIPISQSTLDQVIPQYPDIENYLGGIVILPDGPAFITSMPILKSEGEGPSPGSLIMGRYLDASEIESLSKITHLSLTVQLFNDNQMPAEFQAVHDSFSEDTKIVVKPLNEQSIAGYTVVKDIKGDPALILRVDIPRDIYNQGISGVRFLIISLMVVGIIFILISMWLLEQMVLSRLARLNTDVLYVGKSGDLSRPLVVEGGDEISNLSKGINKMMAELKKFQEHLEEMVAERTLELNKSIEEKEVLLREIHHRVKNNMQVVSSLLLLQTQNIKDEKYLNIFNDSNNRILSIALIHEKLYESKNFVNIDIKEYITELVSNLLDSYGRTGNVKFEINVENVSLDINNSVPCGLIINELVTNSLKHAFPEGRQGIIKITFTLKDNNMLQLSISDDGIGIPKDMDIRNTDSLGLHLVTSIAENQLHGEIILLRDRGTEFQINFRGKNDSK
jgi:two-component sensor histidine kinase/sensor domain CHASE-containing protein